MIILRVMPKQISIEAIDEGRGIADIELPMKEGYSTTTERIWRMGFGAGMGLANMKCFSDFFSITSGLGKGTHIRMIIQID
jgi:anti-sigma regulatory factor (Ser/Thr protein kinase)